MHASSPKELWRKEKKKVMNFEKGLSSRCAEQALHTAAKKQVQQKRIKAEQATQMI